MDFSVSSSSRKKLVVAQEAKGDGLVSMGRVRGSAAGPLLLYHAPPAGMDVSIEDFEEFALDRLQVLKGIENAKARNTKGDELETQIDELIRKHLRVHGNPEETRRKDVISHFVLRLGYCRSDELRKWFLIQECTLFRHRFKAETAENQRRFLEEHGMPYKAISQAELQEVQEELAQVARSINDKVTGAKTAYFKVPFEEVPDLVAGRRVLLKRGCAYVPREQMVAIVGGRFRALLSQALVVTNRLWLQHIKWDERERLSPLVESFHTRHFGDDYTEAKMSVGEKDLDRLALESFPLCMRNLFIRLREDHHLKHGGRLQLGLFLKGVGLRLEDALSFWKAEISQKKGLDVFEKEYSYSIRHNYGKEGKRTDYTPFACSKIISGTPGVGDHHGCPFKTFSDDQLGALLRKVGVADKMARQVREKAKGHHYQIACGVVFEATQGQPCPDAGVSHPNQYFDWSIKAKQGINLREMPAPGGAIQAQPSS